MVRLSVVIIALVGVLFAQPAFAELSGHYIEARTCQVYTGPCFANGEVGLAGKDAVMAWNIQKGDHDGINLGGLSVVVLLRADRTLGFQGIKDAKTLRSTIIVDQRADSRQRRALIDFAKRNTGQAADTVARVSYAPIEMSLDTATLSGRLLAGKSVELTTRKARKGDCICSNESAYYPPLATVENFAPGVTITGNVKARGLGTTWSIPQSRTAYMATFTY
jgi:hypothetical protein